MFDGKERKEDRCCAARPSPAPPTASKSALKKSWREREGGCAHFLRPKNLPLLPQPVLPIQRLNSVNQP